MKRVIPKKKYVPVTTQTQPHSYAETPLRYIVIDEMLKENYKSFEEFFHHLIVS